MSRKSAAPIVTGAVITAAVGTAAYMMASRSRNSTKRKLKKSADKAVQVVGEVMDGFSSMMR